jgi:hypothetical protein
MKAKERAKEEPTEVCRACGRQMSGQDPNVVSRKFLAALVGKAVNVSCPGSDSVVMGTLLRFDNYSLLIEPDFVPPTAGFGNVLVFKGPGVLVQAKSQ